MIGHRFASSYVVRTLAVMVAWFGVITEATSVEPDTGKIAETDGSGSPSRSVPPSTTVSNQPNAPATNQESAEVFNGRGKIVGGNDAPPGRYAWIAAIGRLEGGRVNARCGGTLVAPDWIVSAAHCNLRSDDYAVIGGLDLRTSGGKEIQIVEVQIHPNYDAIGRKESDVVLARLKDKPPTEFLKVIDATENGARTGDLVWVAGWGRTTEDDPTKPDMLKQVEVRIGNRDICQTNYGAIGKRVSQQMLCAAEENRDACTGDSGGPLVVFDDLGHKPPRLAGVVSWGQGCARPEYLGVYTRMSVFADWIQKCTSDATRACCRSLSSPRCH